MLRRMTDMPAGTIGFEAVGEVEDDDWERTVEPRLRDAIAAGDRLRLLYVLSARPRSISQGIDTEEIIATVHATRAPMMSATAGLRL